MIIITEIWFTLVGAIICIVMGIGIRKSRIKNIRFISLYEIEDIEGYRKYISKVFITTGIWLMACIITKLIIKDLELLKVNLLTVLAVIFEYKMKAGNFMAFDEKTGQIKKRNK